MAEPAIVALLAVLVLGVAWLAWEVRAMHRDLQPVLESSILQGLTSF